MPDPTIEFRQVTKRYETAADRVDALSDVTFRIERGDRVAVMGPSGSGKTTLLHLAAGLDRPTAGEVWVNGQLISGLNERGLTRFRAAVVGLVFQDPHLFPGLSAIENVMVARLPFDKRSRLESQAGKLLAAVGMDDRRRHSPAQLSGGERQRVAIARALIGEPAVLLADEPTGNLDAGTTEEILQLLADLHQELGLTMVVVTHDPSVAAACERLMRLVKGSIVSDERIERAPAIEVREVGS